MELKFKEISKYRLDKKLRLIFVNRYFFPDDAAISQILSDLVFDLAQQGYRVEVISSRLTHENRHPDLPKREIVRGVKVQRVSTSRLGARSLIGRAIDYALFFFVGFFALLRSSGRDSVIIATTDPPLLSVMVALVARMRGAKFVNWHQDVFPEVAEALGVWSASQPLARAVIWLRDRSLKQAEYNVVLSQGMGERLVERGAPREGILVSHNWTNDLTVASSSNANNGLKRTWGLQDKFVVGYSGNLGRAHEYQTFIGAAERLRNDERIVFLIVGRGYYRESLEQEVSKRGLTNFQFRPHQPLSMLPKVLNVADLHFVSLRPELDGLVFPSKFYGIAAAGRPIIAITGENSEIAKLIETYDCGANVRVGDADALADLITNLADDPKRCAEMGRNARRMLNQNFTRKGALQRWMDLIDRMEEAAASSP